MLKDLRANMPTSGQQAVFVHEPADTAWLTGEPPPSVPVAAAEPPRTATETVAASPTVPAARPDATAPVNSSEPLVLDDADCRRAQLALRRMGYYDGKPDGLAGPDTRAAIRRFQHELNADMTGRLTRDQTDRLFAATR
jgi:peptidoglycan hydrolase-like protein with peptidoglycan-binding domain